MYPGITDHASLATEGAPDRYSAANQGNTDTVTLSGYDVQKSNGSRLLPDQHRRRHRVHPQECR